MRLFSDSPSVIMNGIRPEGEYSGPRDAHERHWIRSTFWPRHNHFCHCMITHPGQSSRSTPKTLRIKSCTYRTVFSNLEAFALWYIAHISLNFQTEGPRGTDFKVAPACRRLPGSHTTVIQPNTICTCVYVRLVTWIWRIHQQRMVMKDALSRIKAQARVTNPLSCPSLPRSLLT